MRHVTSWTLTAATFLTLVFVVGCGGDSTGPDPDPDPSITLSASPSAVSIEQGESGSTTVSVSRGGGFTGPVVVAPSGLPSGVTAPSLTLSQGQTSAELTFTATSGADTGTTDVTLTGTGQEVSATTTVELEVTEAPTGDFQLSLDPDAVTVDEVPAPAVFGATSTAQAGAESDAPRPADSDPSGPAGSAMDAAAPDATTTVEITRQEPFDGPVELAVTDAPEGLDATLAATTVAGASTTLTVEATAGLAPGGYTVTVTGTADGVAERTAVLQVTVEAVGGFTLTLDPASVTVEQGTSADASVQITRQSPFEGPVDLALSGAPAGLDAVLAETTVAGASTTLTVEASASLAPGTYAVIVTGTADAVADRSTELEVVVEASDGGGGALSVQVCDAAWFAVKDGSDPWMRVTPSGAGDEYSFDASSDAVALAWVRLTTLPGTGADLVDVQVYLLGREEVALFQDPCDSAIDGKTVTGTVTGFGGADFASVQLGFVSTFVAPAAPSFTLDDVPDGPLALLATRGSTGPGTDDVQSDRMIVRRDQDLPDGTDLDLDFGDAEAFDLVDADVTLSGLGGGDYLFSVSFRPVGSLFGGSLAARTSPTSPVTVPTVPAARREAGDLHQLLLVQEDEGRFAYRYYAEPDGETMELGPALGPVTVTHTATSEGVFPSAAFTAQAEYDEWWTATFSQTSGLDGVDVELLATQAYLNGGPPELAAPDFAAVDGWDAAWNLKAGTEIAWEASAASGLLEFVFPTDGAALLFGFAEGTIDP